MAGRHAIIHHDAALGRAETVRTGATMHTFRSRFSVGQILHAACGLFLVVFGAIAVGRAGIGEELGERTGDVLGITLSALLGLVAIGVGLILLLAALSPDARGVGGVLGVLLLVGGIVVAAGSDELLADLHTESALGWVAIIVGAAAIIAAVLPSHSVTYERDVIDAE